MERMRWQDSSSDQLKVIEKIDKGNMLGAVENFPDQCRKAVTVAEQLPLDGEPSGSNFDSLLILGMGGSGISGDIVSCLFEEELDIPIYVNKGYGLPNFVSEKTLCFSVSYSGNTEETLSGFQQAVSRGCTVISISTDGTLEEKASSHDLPFVKIPAGLQPRAALGYLTLPLVVFLSRLGVVKSKKEDIGEMISVVAEKATQWGRSTSMDKNETQLLSMKLHGKIPIVYGSSGISSVAAFRWKCQFNENSKVPSFWHIFPELNHNETVGWEQLKDITQRFCLILLRDVGEQKRVSRRIDITKSLIEKQFGEVIEVSSEGISKLARLFWLIYFGDFTSVYLAVLNGVDPSPVKKVEELKKRLAQGE